MTPGNVSVDPDYVVPEGALTETKVWLASIDQGGDDNLAYDRNGFRQLDASTSYSSMREDRLDTWRMARRVKKWRKMLGVGGTDFEDYLSEKPRRWEKLKRRARKGIPDQVRWFKAGLLTV